MSGIFMMVLLLPNNYLNRPPWIDRIFFYSDEAEIFYNNIKPDWEDNGSN